MADAAQPFVSRGGLKLRAALDAWGIRVEEAVCADLGCNAGGFTDCLLQRGAARVFSVDTGYGALAWKLRRDPRVVVLERTNALHFDPATLEDFRGGCDLVAIDLAWTRQARAVPAAIKWLRREAGEAQTHGLSVPAGPVGLPVPRIITLIKPHYEAERALLPRDRKGVLDPADAQRVADEVLVALPALGVRVVASIASPILGGAGKGKHGNVEYLALLERA
jgi:23S rRNA (cytidine1920-2'-O)/16S rRNA (cytidine1409-2'-O)-methyltransferase